MPLMAEKKMDKTLARAESIVLLRHLMDMELERIKNDVKADIVFFMGVDGRIFGSKIPEMLTTPQYFLLNLVKANVYHICDQLKSKNLEISVQKYGEGSIVIAGVGDKAFIVLIFAKPMEIQEMTSILSRVKSATLVLKHILEQRALTDDELKGYPADVANELKALSRQLFVEKFETTRKYKKNMEVLEIIRKNLAQIVGVGAVDEIVTLTFNELGTTAPYMSDRLWMMFLDKVISRVRTMRGDIVAEECKKLLVPVVEQKLKSFV